MGGGGGGGGGNGETEWGGGGDGGKREQEREWRREGDYLANSHTLRFTKYVAFLKKINHTIYKLYGCSVHCYNNY